ncbi:mobile mystery protein A [Patescibacteria group bacterium]|nr:mobile mystery protein A [Patescibacteria group bacterium]
MKKNINKLQLEQLDRKIKAFNRLNNVGQPVEGWIRSIRVALGMSLEQLSKILGVKPQSLIKVEQREKEGVVNIKTLKQISEVLGLKFVYGFSAPKSSLEKIVKKRAHDVAKGIVLRSDKNMRLEGQGNSRLRIKKAIKERADKIIANQEKILWD